MWRFIEDLQSKQCTFRQKTETTAELGAAIIAPERRSHCIGNNEENGHSTFNSETIQLDLWLIINQNSFSLCGKVLTEPDNYLLLFRIVSIFFYRWFFCSFHISVEFIHNFQWNCTLFWTREASWGFVFGFDFGLVAVLWLTWCATICHFSCQLMTCRIRYNQVECGWFD